MNFNDTLINEINIQDDNKINDLLEHFGVKGMHWGTRNNSSENASSDVQKFKQHTDAIKSGGGIHVLNNDELQHIISRMNLEQQYARLIKDKSSLGKIKNGQSIVKDLVGVVRTVREVQGIVKEIKKSKKK